MDFGHHGPAVWLGFTGVVLLLLVLDLGVLNRRSHVLSFREAITWSASLVGLAHLFGLFLLWREGTGPALEYYTGYLIELSLSVDNLFVFILVFQYFGVPAVLQPRVLKWGILGALIMRAIMIGIGALLLERFSWIIFVFGGILIITGIRMFRGTDEHIEPEKNPIVALARRILPFTGAYEGQRFFVKTVRGKLMATPLLLVLLVVEWTDLVFAIDSIPAIFAVTRDPFLVYSSNVFAIIGLRALFFVLAGMMDKFAYLKPGVAVILVFVGIKMLASHWVHIPTLLSLGVIILTLTVAVLLSLRAASRAGTPIRATPEPPAAEPPLP
ncbi:MAG: TerC family protein [Gemmatimonadota bacterium]|nr:TerC family protein [Gemmatimonadota bacterium]